MMETSIYLIRHAQSHPTSKVDLKEWPLSSVGKAQAYKLSALLGPLGIEKLYSSPFLRCLKTIEPFSKKRGIPVTVEEGLGESLLTHGLVDEFYEIWRRSWDDFQWALPGCETSSDSQRRFVSAVDKILSADDAKTIGVCAHGNVIALYLNRIDPSVGMEQAGKLTNPDVIRIVAQDGRLVWDRDFHLPGLGKIATNHSQTPVDA